MLLLIKKKRKAEKENHTKRGPLRLRGGFLVTNTQFFFFYVLEHEIELIKAVNLHMCFQCTKKSLVSRKNRCQNWSLLWIFCQQLTLKIKRRNGRLIAGPMGLEQLTPPPSDDERCCYNTMLWSCCYKQRVRNTLGWVHAKKKKILYTLRRTVWLINVVKTPPSHHFLS